MRLPTELTIVTPFSKYLAMALFILFPIFGFYFGIQYQKSIMQIPLNIRPIPSLNPVTSIPVHKPTTVDTGVSADWKSHVYSTWSSNVIVKYPPEYVVRDDLAGMTVASSKKALDEYTLSPMTYSDNNSIIITASVSDLRYDTLSAIQKQSTIELLKDPLSSIDLNSPSVRNKQSYQPQYNMVNIQGISTKRMTISNQYIYRIPSKSGKSYVEFYIKPVNSTLMNIAQAMLNSFKVTENIPPYTVNK